MAEKKNSEKLRAEFRYYVIPENEKVLALLGKNWEKEYGEGLNRLHFHNYFEIGICRRGAGKVVINDQVLDFRAGNIMAIPPNVLHTTNVDKGDKAFWEWLYFDIGAVADGMPAADNEINRRRILYKIYSTPLFVSEDKCPVFAQLIELLIREITAKEVLYRKNINDILNLLVVEMFRIAGGDGKLQYTGNSLNRVAPAIEYIGRHYQEIVKMNDLASACNMSESHFRREFTECMNMRPSDYVNLVRVEKACELMKKSEVSMDEVAYKSGFGNVSSLTRNFRKILNTTPYQWKKSSDNYEIQLRQYNISACKGW